MLLFLFVQEKNMLIKTSQAFISLCVNFVLNQRYCSILTYLSLNSIYSFFRYTCIWKIKITPVKQNKIENSVNMNPWIYQTWIRSKHALSYKLQKIIQKPKNVNMGEHFRNPKVIIKKASGTNIISIWQFWQGPEMFAHAAFLL